MLRPVSFSIPSSTQLILLFNENVNQSVSKSNFVVTSVSGNVDDLRILGVEIRGNRIDVFTSPQVSGNFYTLKLIDSSESDFISTNGAPLVNDEVSRELYFTGFLNRNPIRDQMYGNVPKIYNLENSNIKNLIDSTAEEIFQAQKDIGKVLSNNFISENVIDEIRTRSEGATDRLGYENAYEISKVSPNLTGENLIFSSLKYNENFSGERHSSVPKHKISLQEVFVSQEEISISSQGNDFKGFLLSLKNKNVIKLLSLELIRAEDIINCNGEIGTKYLIENYKYSIKDNSYDPSFGFKLPSLESNQILLSEFGNIPEPKLGDIIYVSYLYRDNGIIVNKSSIEVYNLKTISAESIPSNATTFFLENAPIVDNSNQIYTIGGVIFRTGENLNTIPPEFRKEIPFNTSKIPSSPGEYSVNYSTGEVIVAGWEKVGAGTGNNAFIASYQYRDNFIKNLDFYYQDGDLVPSNNRRIVGESVSIDFNYEKVYVEGEDYLAPVHVEVKNEYVQNRFGTSFSIIPQNSPVTNVFRIYNQTTGEVYNPLYFTNNEIFFSGNRSPEFKNQENEIAEFSTKELEKLEPFASFIIPAFNVKIISNASTNSINFYPGIPAEFIDFNSQNYFIRSKGVLGQDPIEDLNIVFFGTPDANNLITSCAISPTATLPSINEQVTIGTRGFAFNLEHNQILDKNKNYIGSFANTSVEFSRTDIFTKEKWFQGSKNLGFTSTGADKLTADINGTKDDIFYQNFSRLRKAGDYAVDYVNGVVYVAASLEQDFIFGTINYSYGDIVTQSPNIIAVTEITRKENSSDTTIDANIIYDNISFTEKTISILDLDNSLILSDLNLTANSGTNSLVNPGIVLDDYTVAAPFNISSLYGVYEESSLTGSGVNSQVQSSRMIEADSSNINLPYENGGYNLISNGIGTFSGNIIDLKKSINKRVFIKNNNYIIQISDSSFSSIYDVIHQPTGKLVFDEFLNVEKIESLEIVNTFILGGNAIADIKSGTILSSIDTTGDYLLDSMGRRFKIIGVDPILSKLTLESPAENNVTALTPSIGVASVVVKATVTYIDNIITISFPKDCFVNDKDPVIVRYLLDITPQVGSKIAINANVGKIYTSYTYAYDDVYVYYEYGDNQIDWSISNSVPSGQNYFVSYKYGALREALRANFGLLTKLPFFTNFSLDVDRELYRNALKGTLQSFTKGPTIPAFKGLVSSFTDIEPEIKESVFGNWILGRDFSNPDQIRVDGDLQFKPAKFSEGIYISDNTIVSMPAVSNLNLSEGTISSWVQPDWGGIDNDATIQVEVENIGEKTYTYKPGTKLFDAVNNFSIIDSDLVIGGADFAAPSIDIHNFDVSLQNGTESTQIGPYGFLKKDSSLTRLVPSTHEIDALVRNFDIISNPISFEQGKAISSPFHFSLDDGNKKIFINLSIQPVFDSLQNLLTFNIVDEDLTYSNLPKYDRLHSVLNCNCIIVDTIQELSLFRDKDAYAIKVNLNQLINIKNNLINFENSPKIFKLIDSKNSIYEVLGFYDDSDKLFSSSIPNLISSVLIARIPENRDTRTSGGTDSFNQIPDSSLTFLVQTAEIIFDSQSNSKLAFGISDYKINLDFYQKTSILVSRKPIDNIVDINIKNQNISKDFVIFYTDLLNTNQFDLIKSKINIISEDYISQLNNQLFIGTLDSNSKNIFSIFKIKYNIFNRFNLSDIYIGSLGYNPTENPFYINKYNTPNSTIGLPINSDVDEGIFIGFDELCVSPLSKDSGQWVFRTRAKRNIVVPTSVLVSGLGIYQNILDSVGIDHNFSGTIKTEGEFSSVVRARRSEDGTGCPDSTVCEADYRFCGEGLLEEVGWTKLNYSDSQLINTILGGFSGERSAWMKYGNHSSQTDTGIYRQGPSSNLNFRPEHNSNLGNFTYTEVPCYNGNYQITVSFRPSQWAQQISSTNLGYFGGQISGNIIGIVPIHIVDHEINIKLALAVSTSATPLLLTINNETQEILDISFLAWSTNFFTSLTLNKDSVNGILEISSDNIIITKIPLSQIYGSGIVTCSQFSSPTLASYVFDGTLIDTDLFHSQFAGNILDIDLIEFSGRYEVGVNTLESDDIFISTDSKIDFNFVNPAFVPDGYDGYGYIPESKYDVDEIYFTSDRFRYLFDSGEMDAKNRISIFKDGKGFLNFRIFDREFKDTNIYNIAANIKHFKPGELHHIAASWRANSLVERDEMHLFIDGKEVPNLFKFGGLVKTRVNDKFSDINKEVLQDYLINGITYYPTYNDGTILAGDTGFTSIQAGFTQDMIGRSVIITGPLFADALIGKQYIINSVNGNEVTFVSGSNLNIVTFTSSISNIEFTFPPTAGIQNQIFTDLRNDRFMIVRKDCNQDTFELGGIQYYIDSGNIILINDGNIINPQFRVNIDSRIIEFIGQDFNCNYVSSISYSDLNIHIETFGLKFENCKDTIRLSSSSYHIKDNLKEDPYSGKSIVLSRTAEPASLSDVEIRRVILPRTIPEPADIISAYGYYLVSFTIDLDNSTGIYSLTSEPGQVYKANKGRYLRINFDSDNAVFCDSYQAINPFALDGYDGYDGYVSSNLNKITVYGTTKVPMANAQNSFALVPGQETFEITKNGIKDGVVLFETVTQITGTLLVADPDYEPCVIELMEKDLITVSNNNGEYAEIYRWINGSFILTMAGSNGFYPFELHPGLYTIEYPTHLRLKLPNVGDRMFIGCDMHGQLQFGGIVDEFRITTEMSSDTKNFEKNTNGTSNITSLYTNPNPSCPDDQTLVLIHFDDPIYFQSRRLRQKVFLDELNNFKFQLDFEDRKELLKYINRKEDFVSKMIRNGFDSNIALQTYIECHGAEGGPIFNESRFIRKDKMFISETSVNSNFGRSARFFQDSPLLIPNRFAEFRNNEGTMEFWVSPLLDTAIDTDERYYIDIYSTTQKRVKSIGPRLISLPTSAKKILSIKLIQATQEFSSFYTAEEESSILFDELTRSKVTGRLEGGSGTQNDFSMGSRLSSDGKTIELMSALPGAEIDVIVTYIPLDSSGDRISVYKDKQSNIIFRIIASNVTFTATKKVDWTRNSWHRIMCVWKANSDSDLMRLFVDGDEVGLINYGDDNLIYGDNFIYGQTTKNAYSSKKLKYNILLGDEFKNIVIGSDIFQNLHAASRMDNVRFSSIIRPLILDPGGYYIDPNFSTNLNTLLPANRDSYTTLLLDFESDTTNDQYATVIDPIRGIYNFDINIIDNFEKINDDLTEDLIVELVNTLKPAHSNALVLFPRDPCSIYGYLQVQNFYAEPVKITSERVNRDRFIRLIE